MAMTKDSGTAVVSTTPLMALDDMALSCSNTAVSSSGSSSAHRSWDSTTPRTGRAGQNASRRRPGTVLTARPATPGVGGLLSDEASRHYVLHAPATEYDTCTASIKLVE